MSSKQNVTWSQEEYDAWLQRTRNQHINHNNHNNQPVRVIKNEPSGKDISCPAIATDSILITPTMKKQARARQHKRHVSGEMNDTEKRFCDEWVTPRMQSGELIDYWFEEWTFKLADGCRYTPDFVVQDKDGFLMAYEVKGTTKNKAGNEIPFAMDDAMVKIKISPFRFPLQFYIAHPARKASGGGWHIIEK